MSGARGGRRSGLCDQWGQKCVCVCVRLMNVTAVSDFSWTFRAVTGKRMDTVDDLYVIHSLLQYLRLWTLPRVKLRPLGEVIMKV